MNQNTVSAQKVYLVAGKRTPFGKFGGSLASLSPVDLAEVATKNLFISLKTSVEIDHVLFANVLPSTSDTLYAGRHLALRVGLPQTTPAYSINRLCGSGFQVLWEAKRLIQAGEAQSVLAAGAENMSLTPHLLYGGRFGKKYGNLDCVDLLSDALTDAFAKIPMGMTAENLAQKYNISREEAEKFSYESHQRAERAFQEGHFSKEIAPVELKRGVLEKDEHLRPDISLEQMKSLRPSFVKDGTVTPATASGIVDGGVAILVASEEYCKKHNLTPLAEIIEGHVEGVDPTIMGIGPVPAIRGVLKKTNTELSSIDLVEINEAFAPQALACAKELNIEHEKLNVWGGAIALGHPLGATGLRITHTLAQQLNVYKKKWGIASACIGGGQGIALLLKSYM